MKKIKNKNARRAIRPARPKTKKIAMNHSTPRPEPAIGGEEWKRQNGLATIRDEVRLYLDTHYTPAGPRYPLPDCLTLRGRKARGRR